MKKEDLLKNAKPILFNTEMVKSILDGRKTQTRRVIPYGEYLYEPMNELCIEVAKNYCDMDEENHPELKKEMIGHSKYKIDDILYVRETFVVGVPNGSMSESEYNPLTVFYKADDSIDNWIDEWEDEVNIPWKPSIHMPKKYARIFLKVTNVRVERLHDIEHEDILKEGIIDLESWVYNDMPEYEYCVTMKSQRYDSAEDAFIELWNSTAKDGYKWEDNPYVFVYEFERALPQKNKGS